ncbi:MAG: hypothetical protein QM756_03635 [Polyangiaceae bacterium]
MGRALVAMGIAALAGGCSGIQGGSEGEETGHCVYRDVTLTDPDAVPEGFTKSPRELLAAAQGRFSGKVRRHAVSLDLATTLDDLSAHYDESGFSNCKPGLSSSASATLVLDDLPAQPAAVAGLELRAGSALAMATFEASADAPLVAVTPTFAGTVVDTPFLDLWLTFDAAGASSHWQWRAFVACDAGQQCSGGPSPSGAATNGAEVNWGDARLSRE